MDAVKNSSEQYRELIARYSSYNRGDLVKELSGRKSFFDKYGKRIPKDIRAASIALEMACVALDWKVSSEDNPSTPAENLYSPSDMYAESIDLQWIKDLGKPSALFNQLRLARQKALFSEDQKTQAIQFALEALEKALPIFQQHGLQKAVEVTTTLLDYVGKESSPMTQPAAAVSPSATPQAEAPPPAVAASAASDEQMGDVKLAYAVLAALEKLSPKKAGWTTHSLTTALAKLGHKSLVDLLVPENGRLTVENKDNKRALNNATMENVKNFMATVGILNSRKDNYVGKKENEYQEAKERALDAVASASVPSQLLPLPLAQKIYTHLTGKQITAAAAQAGAAAYATDDSAAAIQPPAEPPQATGGDGAGAAPASAEPPAANAGAGTADQGPPAGEQTEPPPVDQGQPPAQAQQQTPPPAGEEPPPPTATGEGTRTHQQVVEFWNTIADADDDRSDAFGLAASETRVAIEDDQARKKITLTKGQTSTTFYDDGKKLTFGDVNGNFNRELDAKAAAYAILNDERFANGATIESPTAEFVAAVKEELQRQLGDNTEQDTFEASDSGKKIVFKRPSGYSPAAAAQRPAPRQAALSVAPTPGQRAAA